MLRSVLAVLAVVVLPFTAPAQTVQHPFTFTRVPVDFPELRNALSAWADYDGDGDLDLLLSGDVRVSGAGDYEVQARLYRNDGAVADPTVPGGQRPQLTDVAAALVPLAFGDAAWGDYDGDGDLDLALLGSTTHAPPYAPRTLLYRNDAGTLALVDVGLADLHSGSLAWADHDGDGDLDLLLSGTASASAPYTPETHLYLNTGGAFAETPTDLPPLVFGTFEWMDFRGDARPDVFLSGLTPAGIVAVTYEQRGGQYVAVETGEGVLFGRAAIAPQNGGGTSQALTGATPSATYFSGRTALSNGSFAEPLFGGDVDFGDLDGDGDLDFAVTGQARQYAPAEFRVYQDIDGTLTEKNFLLGSTSGPMQFLDYDGDGDLDLFAAGHVAALYRNDRARAAVVPGPPSGLTADVQGDAVTLRWDGGDAPNATYDVWVGTAPGRFDVVAPAALPASGYRTLPAAGRMGTRTEITLAVGAGTYHWGVQEVSAERVGSAFATGPAFTLVATGAAPAEIPTAFALDAPAPSPFHTQARLRYHLPRAAGVALAVYDATGRRVRTLVAEPRAAGTHETTWDGRDDAGVPVASGVYLCRLVADSHSFTRTLLFVR